MFVYSDFNLLYIQNEPSSASNYHFNTLIEMKNSLVQHKVQVKPSIARGTGLPPLKALSNTDPQDQQSAQPCEHPRAPTPTDAHCFGSVATFCKSRALPNTAAKQDIQLFVSSLFTLWSIQAGEGLASEEGKACLWQIPRAAVGSQDSRSSS